MRESSLKKLIREFISEKMLQAVCVIETDRGTNLTEIFDTVRGVCGITVVTVLKPARPISEYKELTRLKIKFFQTDPSLKKHLKKMKLSINQLDGVYGFRILRVGEIETKKKD